eukprot:1384586-Rhodomonas_salina.2
MHQHENHRLRQQVDRQLGGRVGWGGTILIQGKESDSGGQKVPLADGGMERQQGRTAGAGGKRGEGAAWEH